MRLNKILCSLFVPCVLVSLCLVPCASEAAVSRAGTTKTQSAVQRGTSVRTRVAPTGLYSQECYDAYYGCMDQFCISDNIDGGSCACSDENAKYEQQLAMIKQQLSNAEDIRTIEVEKIQAGARADIIFGGTRQYDEHGNVIAVGEKSAADEKAEQKAQRKRDLMAMFEDAGDEDVFESAMETVVAKTGAALYLSADELCRAQMPASCANDVTLLKQVYARQIVSDCKGFENSVADAQANADIKLAEAQSAVRGALADSFNAANKFDRGTCMVEFRKCMQEDDACGSDWTKCVSVIANENMQNNQTVSTANTTVETVVKYEITDSTMEILESKRHICERVLDQCIEVRNYVWNDFLREAAPTIRLAELNAESKMRQSCLTTVSDCVLNACRVDILGKGVATMDACLARPEMARSFCKIEIDRCERMEPNIWEFTKDKLDAQRVDACTAEVKECILAEERCGADFSNCIGMDYEFVKQICPIDKLVVCKREDKNFTLDKLDKMIWGLYLNMDNSAYELCQNKLDSKMLEVCGSTTDCNRFATDDTIGTGSLRSQKDGAIYRVTGMISFGSIKMGDSTTKNTARRNRNVRDDGKILQPGQIGVADYLEQVRDRNQNVANADGIISSIEEELNNIAGTINRTIQLIEQDPEIQYCVNGRNLSQITGQNKSTKGRYPNLLDSVKMQIAQSALRAANDNYNKKYNEAIAAASYDASTDLAQYMCQMLPVNGGTGVGGTATDTPLAPPYAISYDVGSGLTTADLTLGGASSRATSGTAVMDSTAGVSKASEFLGTLNGLGGNKVRIELPSGTREIWSVFDRESRNCRYCTSTVTKSCSATKKKGFLGIGAKDEMNCTESEPVESCQDIPMRAGTAKPNNGGGTTDPTVDPTIESVDVPNIRQNER